MAGIIARWEWRTFGPVLVEAEKALLHHEPEQVRRSSEVYVLSRRSGENTKIRAGLMDVKTLHRVNEEGLEQWYPALKAGFPIGGEDLVRVFAAWRVAPPSFSVEPYGLEAFLEEIVAPHPDLRAVRVDKERVGYLIDGCIVELANLTLDGEPMRTASVEAEDPARVAAMLARLGWGEMENVNYVRALKQFLGWGK